MFILVFPAIAILHLGFLISEIGNFFFTFLITWHVVIRVSFWWQVVEKLRKNTYVRKTLNLWRVIKSKLQNDSAMADSSWLECGRSAFRQLLPCLLYMSFAYPITFQCICFKATVKRWAARRCSEWRCCVTARRFFLKALGFAFVPRQLGETPADPRVLFE